MVNIIIDYIHVEPFNELPVKVSWNSLLGMIIPSTTKVDYISLSCLVFC